MMKRWLIILTALVIMMSANAVEECRNPTITTDIPCLVISTYPYPLNCENYTVSVFDESPTFLRITNMSDYGNTSYCNTTFIETTIGSYLLNFSSGESATIIVREDENMSIALIFGLGVTTFLLFYLAFKLEKSHYILQLLIIFMGITFIFLIPAYFIIDNVKTIFFRAYAFFFLVFWIYVFVYFVHRVLTYFGVIVSKKK